MFEIIRSFDKQTWLGMLIGVTIALAGCLAFSLPYAEPDLWGHVQFGRDALQHGLPDTTTYSFTADGFTWINHENLSEIALALVLDSFGITALLAGKCLLGLGILAIVALQCRNNNVNWLIVAVSTMLLASSLCSFWQIRPQLISYVFFALLLMILDRAFKGWQGHWHVPFFRSVMRAESSAPSLNKHQLRWLWLTIPLLAVWANSHGGFVAGFGVLAFYLACRGTEIWLVLRKDSYIAVRLMSIVLLLGGLATLATPYGYQLHRWLLMSLGSPRPEITEWHPLGMQCEAFFPFLFLSILSLLGVLLSRRPVDATRMMVFAIVMWQAIAHQRHVPFAAMLMCFWFPVHWQSAWNRIQSQRDTSDLQPTRWMFLALGGANVILLAILVPRLTRLKVDRSHFPVSAISYMEQNGVQGRLVVTYNWAQYVIGALGARNEGDPGVRVSFDGRFRTCYPQSIVDEHFNFVLGDSPVTGRSRQHNSLDASQTLLTGTPELVLVSRNQKPSIETMSRNESEWALLYQDQLAQLWGLRSVFDSETSARNIPQEQRVVSEQPQTGVVSWPAIPHENAQLVSRQ